eukprot:Phypoly_transcript_10665.p1 GENE.Phypoly_transcript_10665~~Phypoly_transcript_10665.p1  ORF type:complete len:196 (+),score=29.45 Phypoly_transcript_10665:617-1204(+)
MYSRGGLNSSGGYTNQGLSSSGGYSTVNNTGLYSNGISTVNAVEANPILERTIVGAPVIQETVRTDRVVEVQPILHRNVDHNIVHHIERHIQEPAAPPMGGVYERNPIVEQTVQMNVVNEIQPIIHRERVVPVSERVETHLMERVAEPTVHTHEVVYEVSNTTYANQNAYAPGTTNAYGQTTNAGTHKKGLFHRH